MTTFSNFHKVTKGCVKSNNSIGTHFNGPGHSLDNLQYTAVEKVYSKSESVLKKRESLWIRQFEAEHQGLNDRK